MSSSEAEKSGAPKLGCGPVARYPIVTMLVCAGAGLGIGYGLSVWTPENKQSKTDAVKWVGLVGDMFLRMLRCVILPLVFMSVLLSVNDMLKVGRAKTVGLLTFGLYLTTTVVASLVGIANVVLFKGLFVAPPRATPKAPGRFEILCSPGYFLTELANGTASCAPLAANQTRSGASQQFAIVDLDNTFVKTAASGPASDISFSDTLYDGVFKKLISENIVSDFATANFASVIIFAIAFGVAVFRATVVHTLPPLSGGRRPRFDSLLGPDAKAREPALLEFFRQLEKTLIEMIAWVLLLTPFAVMSLIANAVGRQSNLGAMLANVGWLVVCCFSAYAMMFALYVLFLWVAVRENPFAYLRHIFPAQCVAFASASSAATIPVNLKCAIGSGMVRPYIANFVIPLGATLNMDGTAIYFPIAVIFLAVTSGLADQINAGTYIMLVLLSTIGSAGTAPVPSASLVLVITAYNTVFSTVGTPETMSLLLMIDWLLDRGRTTISVTGDAVVARIVSARAEPGDFECADEQASDIESSASAMHKRDEKARCEVEQEQPHL
jgi:Na+/H+-dicarboxylate symporter